MQAGRLARSSDRGRENTLVHLACGHATVDVKTVYDRGNTNREVVADSAILPMAPSSRLTACRGRHEARGGFSR